jgi:hypothetical protein
MSHRLAKTSTLQSQHGPIIKLLVHDSLISTLENDLHITFTPEYVLVPSFSDMCMHVLRVLH